jgi:hypothetical protein
MLTTTEQIFLHTVNASLKNQRLTGALHTITLATAYMDMTP